MANAFCYLVQRLDYDHYSGENEQLEVLGVYSSARPANQHAKAEARRIYRNSDPNHVDRPEDLGDGECYLTELRIAENDIDHIVIQVKKTLCETSFNGADYTDDEDNEDRDEYRDYDNYGEEVDDGPQPSLPGPSSRPAPSGRASASTASPRALIPPRVALEIPLGAPNCLAGLSFALAGIQKPFNRAQIIALIKRYGGIRFPMDPVSNKIDYVIVGSDVELNVSQLIIDHKLSRMSQRQFFEMIKTSPSGDGGGSGERDEVEVAEGDAVEEVIPIKSGSGIVVGSNIEAVDDRAVEVDHQAENGSGLRKGPDAEITEHNAREVVSPVRNESNSGTKRSVGAVEGDTGQEPVTKKQKIVMGEEISDVPSVRHNTNT